MGAVAPATLALAQPPTFPRRTVPLEDGWLTTLGDPPGAEQVRFDDSAWTAVHIPHNWEDYQGYTRKSHGNLHGTAWYRRPFRVDEADGARRVFLEMEGVGSYASVFLNGIPAGSHNGGRTGFTIDLTPHLLRDRPNLLAVRAHHPAMIDDLPYVCGGCWGSPNAEGSQPFGIFRPARLLFTAPVRIAPFGVHVRTPEISAARAVVRVATEVTNYGDAPAAVAVLSEVLDAARKVIASHRSPETAIPRGATQAIEQTTPPVANPRLWSPGDPYLHHVRSTVLLRGQPVDTVETRFGFRWIEWPIEDAATAEKVIDPAKLAEAPTRANRYFSRETGRPTNSVVSIQPVQVNIPSCTAEAATVHVRTPIRNDSAAAVSVKLSTFLRNFDGTKFLYSMEAEQEIGPRATYTFDQTSPVIHFPELWSPERPYLHVVETTVAAAGVALGSAETTFGIFVAEGLANRGNAYVAKSSGPSRPTQFRLNGEPFFLNGTCEYEHLLGNDHAFTAEQIAARVRQIKAAGFNALREAHHPHNLRYLELCDSLGLLVWPQVTAHLYFDNDRFRDNYRQAVREWVRERRNSPAVVLWGIQNESSLPTAFARELTALIRSLDPTTSSERKTTTCNGGTGADWDVPQNWLGTYGGNVNQYGDAVVAQKLIGEYGQYRTLGLHAEGDWSKSQGSSREVPEELFTYCQETRIRLAEEKRGQFCGQFQWIFSTHANPGRSEDDCRDGLGLDAVGVVNYKGLLTCWGEPVDAYYMYRANYAPADREPMVYIASHTWPDAHPTITVFSNCGEVELFNDRGDVSLGVRKRGSRGTHFEWGHAALRYDTLYAEARQDGRTVARDLIKLRNLPRAPRQAQFEAAQPDNTAPQARARYLYRVNCGGSDYTDVHGNLWSADRNSTSFAAAYPALDPRYASQRRVHDPIAATRDPELHQTYRYGRQKLRYRFEVPDAAYRVELYFIEPWYGVGGGLNCTGWRLFDVAINDRTVLLDLDIWKEAGVYRALKKVVPATVTSGALEIHFPIVKSYQAVLSAIAIAAI
jgi:beta-galactosidase/beta-glucuronidase